MSDNLIPTIQTQVSLQPYNTFGLAAQAERFVEVHTVAELQALLPRLQGQPKFLLGGGSNLLLGRDLTETVIYLNIKGLRVVSETDNQVVVEAMAGENWHQFVLWTLEQGWGGIENLSLIPGHVGTTPVQNIGAYGVEIKDVMRQCTAVDIESGEVRIFSLQDCQFGYRDSYFKREGKGQYAIVAVQFVLTKTQHQLRTAYGDIQKELEAQGVSQPTPTDISRAVIAIRSRKLPDPKVLGNSGSFFKNPVVPATVVQQLLHTYPDMPHYAAGPEHFKVPAGWLIEKAGLKGQRWGDAGIHAHQALVIVNYGGATGAELCAVAQRVQDTVYQQFQIALEAEVNIIL